MTGGGERTVYRAIIIVIVVVGALGLLWLLTQGHLDISDQGIFRFFPESLGGWGAAMLGDDSIEGEPGQW